MAIGSTRTSTGIGKKKITPVPFTSGSLVDDDGSVFIDEDGSVLIE
jgi:hypothetical protein